MTDYVTTPDGRKLVVSRGYTGKEYKELFNLVGASLKNGGSLDDIEAILSNDIRLPDFVKDFMRAKYHVFHNDYLKALPLIDEVVRRMEADDTAPEQFVPEAHQIIRDVYGLAGEIYANCGQKEKALHAYQDYQLVICQLSPSKSYEGLLSFRNYNVHTLEDLLNRTLTVCSPTVMNDPYDTLLLKWGEAVRLNKASKPHVPLLCESFNSYRIRSFCKLKDEEGRSTIKSVLMWSHYADGHKGFCIEYNFSKDFLVTEERRVIRFKDIMYWDKDNTLDLNINSITTDTALCLKLYDWKYENEIRLITYMPDEEGNFVSLPLATSARIKSIFFGYKCPDEHIKTITKALSSFPDIKYYRMVSRSESIFHLDAVPLGQALQPQSFFL